MANVLVLARLGRLGAYDRISAAGWLNPLCSFIICIYIYIYVYVSV